MGHLLACRLITILMDWDRSDSSACMTLTGGEGGRAEKTGVKAVLEEGAYWRKKRTTFGFNYNTAENVANFIFSAVLGNPPDTIGVNGQDLDSTFLGLTRGSLHHKSMFTHSDSHTEDREMTSYHDFTTHIYSLVAHRRCSFRGYSGFRAQGYMDMSSLGSEQWSLDQPPTELQPLHLYCQQQGWQQINMHI